MADDTAFEGIGYRGLQKLCKERGINGGGTAAALRTRLMTATDAAGGAIPNHTPATAPSMTTERDDEDDGDENGSDEDEDEGDYGGLSSEDGGFASDEEYDGNGDRRIGALDLPEDGEDYARDVYMGSADEQDDAPEHEVADLHAATKKVVDPSPIPRARQGRGGGGRGHRQPLL